MVAPNYYVWQHVVTHQAPVVQKVDNAIHRINHYPLDIAIGFRYYLSSG